MKKLIAIIICFALLSSNMIYADNFQSISDKMNSIWLSPTEDATVLENIYKANETRIEEEILSCLNAPGYAREQIGLSRDDDEMKKQIKEIFSVKEDEILKVYYMENRAYSKKYADANVIRYLISDDYYWFMRINELYNRYEADGDIYNYKNDDFSLFGFETVTREAVEFLKNSDKLSKAFGDIDISLIQEVKVFALNQVCTCLYVNCGNDEYIMCLYMVNGYDDAFVLRDWIKGIEKFKLYNAKEFMQIISDEEDIMNDEKPTFEAEALSLQQEGLLQGNEKGLDLLKPLTRIEAATILLRAMGESFESGLQTQTFSDVPTSHWGYGAAENAYSLGLIKGVGDNRFAPDEAVTGDQFATMVLRAVRRDEFNWEEALEILVREGIISERDSITMDFFTRGDMAKIIYEARENALF